MTAMKVHKATDIFIDISNCRKLIIRASSLPASPTDLQTPECEKDSAARARVRATLFEVLAFNRGWVCG
jgi:hypothetical protein